MAKELKIEDGAVPDPELPDALKLFPSRLIALANKHQKTTREAIALTVKRSPASIGRWLRYESLGDLPVATLIDVETGFRLPPGTLLLPNSIELDDTATVPDIAFTAAAMGMPPSVIRGLVEGSGRAMSEFGVGLRRAILGAVHLMGLPLETVIAAAEDAQQRLGSVDLKPEAWLAEMRPALQGKTNESGTYPSSGNIKIG